MNRPNSSTTPRVRTAGETSDPKQERAIRTRGAILVAAAELFAEHGFPDVTIKNVADRAELTKGAIYFHFANKEALAVAVTDHFYRRLGAVVRAAHEGNEASPAVVRDLFLQVATAFRDDLIVQAGTRLQLERSYIKAPLPTPYTEFTELISELLTECRDSGTLPETVDPAALARVLRSALFGAQHISWVSEGRSDIVERVQEITEALLPAT
ncbi:ScbR family autoregulator-binding transcription factor [Streptomyces sp. NPDC088725]|uniref:ScbR family autoregulator-binding transcription factor n=1 Tax=Streptomyces sp. NPDC088725 TaxID=3365873 RepID=UPI0038051EE6